MDPKKEKIVRLIQVVLVIIGEVALAVMGKWYYGLILIPLLFEPIHFFLQYFKNK